MAVRIFDSSYVTKVELRSAQLESLGDKRARQTKYVGKSSYFAAYAIYILPLFMLVPTVHGVLLAVPKTLKVSART